MPATMLAFDDTDSPEGMCTTFLTALMLEELREYDLLGPPRLVRLNPNIPWKTRGNAAVALPLGHGIGPSTPCGRLADGDLRCYTHGKPANPKDLLDRAAEVITEHARFECHGTNPGLVVCNTRPSPRLYWRAVREVLTVDEVETHLIACGASWRKFKGGRGIIGAAAAAAWRPKDRTWEVITYRDPSRTGTPRTLDPQSVIDMDKATKSTFNNYDYENGHVAISPGSPCPVLFGIRGDSPEELLVARDMIRGEEPSRWLLYMTNQGTDDHISRMRVRALTPGASALVKVRVAADPYTVPGGHVIVRISDGDEVDAVFYEPSRGLRDVARALVPGDRLLVAGSVRSSPRSLNVEKLKVERLVGFSRKVENPRCSLCDKRMGSMGRGGGYRCKRCGARVGPEAAMMAPVERSLALGWYEPPVSSRRHLHKPLRRMSRVDINKI